MRFRQASENHGRVTRIDAQHGCRFSCGKGGGKPANPGERIRLFHGASPSSALTTRLTRAFHASRVPKARC
jgi:hypothetical protein